MLDNKKDVVPVARPVRVRMPSATSVVARSYPDRIIGVDNQLPWHLRSDLKYFRKLTQNHAIIMGRKTYQSIGKPLPNRLNIVLSREKYEDSESLKWVSNPETALLIADQYCIVNGKKEFFVIGGEKIYQIFSRYVNKVFLTEVFTGPINGDAKFDFDFDNKEWRTGREKEIPKSEHDDFPFRITNFIRRKQFHRFKSRSEFMKNDKDFTVLWQEYEMLMSKTDSGVLPEGDQTELFSDLVA